MQNYKVYVLCMPNCEQERSYPGDQMIKKLLTDHFPVTSTASATTVEDVDNLVVILNHKQWPKSITFLNTNVLLTLLAQTGT